MISPLNYYFKVKDEQHIFIYCVAGRSSSTAFQRIINSSNTVWIWGEQQGIIDETVTLINLMKKCMNDNQNFYSLSWMYNSFKSNKHLDFYPNAIGNLETTIDILNSSISNILKPGAFNLKRFGFKDINIKSTQTLTHLKEIFTQSFIVFGFRDPIKQWPSVRTTNWWQYSKELNLFLDEYFRLSSIYLDFFSQTGTCIFIENSDLRDYNKVEKIITYLNIPKIDSELIDVTVSSAGSILLSEEDRTIILRSDAYKNYLEMKNISKSFYNP